MAYDNYCRIAIIVVSYEAMDAVLHPDGACAQPSSPTSRAEVVEGERVGSCLINIWGCESSCVILQADSRFRTVC